MYSNLVPTQPELILVFMKHEATKSITTPPWMTG